MKRALLAVSLLTGTFLHAQVLGSITLKATNLTAQEQAEIVAEVARELLKTLGHGSAQELLQPNSSVSQELTARLRYALQQRGYFKAAVGPLTAALSPDRSTINVLAVVTEGTKYRFGSLTFKNVDVLPFDRQRRAFTLRPGDVFNVDQIRSGIDQLKHELCTRGYLNAAVDPDPWTDDKEGTISLMIGISDGGLFRFGSLTLSGPALSPPADQALHAAWKMLEGQPVDCGARVQQFLRENAGLLPPAFDASRDVHSDFPGRNHIVNFTLTF